MKKDESSETAMENSLTNQHSKDKITREVYVDRISSANSKVKITIWNSSSSDNKHNSKLIKKTIADPQTKALEINFHGDNVTVLNAVVKGLSENKKLRKLKLSWAYVNAVPPKMLEPIKKFAKAVKNLNQLRYFAMKTKRYDHELQWIIRALTTCSQFEKLKFRFESNYGFCNDLIKLLNNNTHLKKLDLADCVFGESQTKLICSNLNNLPNLKTLYIGGNIYGRYDRSDKKKEYPKRSHDNEILDASLFSNLSHLTHLNLDNTVFCLIFSTFRGLDELRNLFTYLERNKLKYLSLLNWSLDTDGYKAYHLAQRRIFFALKKCSELHELRLSINVDTHIATDKKSTKCDPRIKLERSFIIKRILANPAYDEANNISNFLNNSKLRKLTITKICIHFTLFASILKSITSNATITHLTISTCKIQKKDFNPMDDTRSKSCQFFCNMLEENNNLRMIDCSQTNWELDEIKLIVKSLAKNNSITKFKMPNSLSHHKINELQHKVREICKLNLKRNINIDAAEEDSALLDKHFNELFFRASTAGNYELARLGNCCIKYNYPEFALIAYEAITKDYEQYDEVCYQLGKYYYLTPAADEDIDQQRERLKKAYRYLSISRGIKDSNDLRLKIFTALCAANPSFFDFSENIIANLDPTDDTMLSLADIIHQKNQMIEAQEPQTAKMTCKN